MPITEPVAVVIPCYNEAERLDTAEFGRALDQHPKLEFVFVDDGSSDRTLEVLDAFRQSRASRVRVLSLEKNSGKAEAVRRGVLLAFELEPKLIGYWDADLATPLSYIEDFAHVLEDARIRMVVGARVRLLGRRIERRATRHYIGRVFATLASLALDLPVYDTQCGAKLFRATPDFHEVFATPFSLGWTFDVELFGRVKRQAARTGGADLREQVVEYPLMEWVDKPGSKLRVTHWPKILLELVQVFYSTRR